MEGLVSIKNQLIGGLGSILTYLNPWHENFMLKPVIDGLSDLKGMFVTLLDYFNPLSQNFFLRVAFIPQSAEFELKRQELLDTFKQKFIFYENIVQALEQIKNLGTGQQSKTLGVNNSSTPTFDITLPSRYGGGTYTIIDFSYFSEYRSFILNFQRCIMWFFFIKGMFRSLPKATSMQG